MVTILYFCQIFRDPQDLSFPLAENYFVHEPQYFLLKYHLLWYSDDFEKSSVVFLLFCHCLSGRYMVPFKSNEKSRENWFPAKISIAYIFKISTRTYQFYLLFLLLQ